MPLDLLLENAGDYERTHQVVLYVLFKEGRLAEHLGLPPARSVGWEDEGRLFDLTLKDGGRVTGVEVKTWSTVGEDQADRQRAWAKAGTRKLAYVLMGFSEFEDVPGDVIGGEHHFGAKAIRDAMTAVAKDDRCGSKVRGLADAYGRWLDGHLAARIKSLSTPKDKWGRLEYSVAYQRIREALGWPSDIYYVANPAGGVYILNFDEWHDLGDRRARGTQLYWELINGVPHFKIGPVPKNADAREVRAELRELLEAAAQKHDLPIEFTGRTGAYMSLARATKSAMDFMDKGALDEDGVRNYLGVCRKVHERTFADWKKLKS